MMGNFIAPAPMYESYKKVFENALSNHDRELLIPYKGRFNRGFEVPMEFSYEDKNYPLRMIILFDHGLRKQKQKALQNRIQRTRDDFKELFGKLNRYKLKSQEQIDAACAAILKKNKTESFFTYTVINNPVTTYKNSKRGRPAANAEKIAVVNDHFTVQYQFDENAFKKAISQCGYYPLLTNKPANQLSIEEAMLVYKNQYKCEHTFRRAKGPYSIDPHLPTYS